MPVLSGLAYPDPTQRDSTSTRRFQAILSVCSTAAFSLTIGARSAHRASESRSGSVGSPPFTPVPTEPGRGRAAWRRGAGLWHLTQQLENLLLVLLVPVVRRGRAGWRVRWGAARVDSLTGAQLVPTAQLVAHLRVGDAELAGPALGAGVALGAQAAVGVGEQVA